MANNKQTDNVKVICIEAKDRERVEQLLLDKGIKHHELANFFDIEQFKTLTEIDDWWNGWRGVEKHYVKP